MRNPYEVLGVDPSMGVDEIKSAYKRKAQAAHPDRSGGSTEEMESLTWAWGVLGDPDKRAFWDGFGKELGPEGLAGEGKREAEKALITAVDYPGNLVIAARLQLRDRVRSAEVAIRQLEKQVKRAQDHLERLSGGNGKVHSLIRSGIEALQGEIAKQRWICRVMESALVSLEDYHYAEEETSLEAFGHSYWGNK